MEIPTLSQKQVCALLELRHEQVIELEQRGQLRAIRLTSHTIRYFPSDVEACKVFIRKNKKKGVTVIQWSMLKKLSKKLVG